MTSSSSTPDIASQVATLSLSSQPSQQRLHDTYDFEGNADVREFVDLIDRAARLAPAD